MKVSRTAILLRQALGLADAARNLLRQKNDLGLTKTKFTVVSSTNYRSPEGFLQADLEMSRIEYASVIANVIAILNDHNIKVIDLGDFLTLELEGEV